MGSADLFELLICVSVLAVNIAVVIAFTELRLGE